MSATINSLIILLITRGILSSIRHIIFCNIFCLIKCETPLPATYPFDSVLPETGPSGSMQGLETVSGRVLSVRFLIEFGQMALA